MKTKVICWLMACAILLSAAPVPVAVFATGTETDPTTQTEATVATDPTEESSESTEETTAPSEETSEPTEESSEPTEETTEPTTAPTEPEDKTLKISDDMMKVLKELEGCYTTCYWDYKQYSIGYGSRCPETVHEPGKFHTITREYAEELLRGELAYFEKEVNKFIEKHGLTVTQSQYDALVSFSYNCGANWTTETTGYFYNGVLSGDLGSEFVYGMFLWSTAGGQYVLIPRRIRETYMYSQGLYKMGLWYPEDPQYRYVFMNGNGGKVNYYIHGFDAYDPTTIRTQLTSAPTGPDETGGIVTYVFDGWYTAREGGTKIEVLDTTMTSGTILYAHWKTPAGTPVTIPKVDTGVALNLTVTANGVNIRSGPQTYFAALGKVNKGDKLVIEEIVTAGGYPWGRFGDSWIRLDYTDYKSVTANMFPFWGKVTGDGVNIRSGAGLSHGIVTKKNTGDLVQIKRWVSDGERMWGETDEGYIAMSYVSVEDIDPAEKVALSIKITQNPTKLQYLHMTEQLDPTGGLFEILYSDGTTQVQSITADMLSGFDHSVAGKNTVTVTYEGLTAQFDVEIIKAKVVFRMDDGTILSEGEYLIGDTIVIPTTPEKPGNKDGVFVFVGWDQEVTTCTGNAVYTAVFQLVERVGDINKDGNLNDRDVIYLLRHILFPELYPFSGTTDMNGDGEFNDRDAVYLLRHILFPELFPLKAQNGNAN